ncbi:MAG: hypothetical protein DM484_10305 [Candidatus Methylumidiphilus alinenensis]|uniref:DUF4410 domain-containing protein n=1 Tax=Candidatus Methylumidiphilus alinenensis TaxID=2202197 RepID=A0A2W4T603_9GAMM|nr:MAG: hypothetical protein DM484_10305 [Candidatus Methylumidiphilus alinenensis]
MRMTFLLKYLAPLALVLLASGCAKTNVRATNEVAYTGLPRPERVLIYNFAVSPADIQENSSIFAKIGRNMENKDQTAEEIQVGREVADALATELTTKIAGMGLNSLRADRNMPITKGSILITGQFTKIDEGNRLRRNLIGLGMGQSSVDAAVSVLAPGGSELEEIIAFNAHADSGNMPGAGIMGPAGAAAGAGTAAVLATNAAMTGVKTYKSASATQAKKIAEKIAAELAKYFAQQGWINPALAQ